LFPEIRFEGAYQHETFSYRGELGDTGGPGGRFSGNQNQFGTFLAVDWDLFDGFERVEKVKRRLAEEEAARAEFEIQRLDTILDVWSSYYAVLTSRRQVQFAQAAMSSSQENFDATQAFFGNDLATITELVSAQSELAAAPPAAILNRFMAEQKISLLQECTSKYDARRSENGEVIIEIRVPSRFRSLWLKKLSELETTLKQIDELNDDG
jgi:outer membrane protein TolC